MSYKIIISKNFEKRFNKLSDYLKERVKKILIDLENNLLGSSLKGDLSGFYSIHFERNKYRIIYFLNDVHIEIVAVHVGKRTDSFYTELKKKI